MERQITVTSPLLPSLEELDIYLRDIWHRKSITNNGYYHQELEDALCEYLGVPYISLFTNGTLPLNAPPSIVLNTFVAWKLNADISPAFRTDLPLISTPNA